MPSTNQSTQLYRKYMQNLALTYKNRQDLRLFTEILLTSATAVIFILFAIKPTLTTISDLYTEMGVKEDTINTMDAKIENLKKAEVIYKNEAERLKLLDIAIPNSPVPEDFIRQIESLAQKNNTILIGLTLSEANITQSLTQPQESAEEIQVTLKVAASYESLLSFLSELELMRRPLFTQFGVITLGDTTDPADITLTITGTIPFARKPIENSV